MVKQPKIFSLEDLDRYPMVTRMGFVECGGNSAPMFSSEPMQATAQALHGLVSNSEWTGVLLSTLLDEVGVDPKAKWFLAEAPMLRPHRSVPVKKGFDDAMIALYQNGERIMPGNGYPMRLLLPGYQGNMNVKFLRRIKLIDQPAMSFYEAKTYSQVLPGERFWRFHFLQEVKSFITHPSFGNSLKGPWLLRDFRRRLFRQRPHLKGQGFGRRRQELGAGGAAGHSSAAGLCPLYPPWRWDGQPAILVSRAWDEAGHGQPLRPDFVAARGQTDEARDQPVLLSPTSTTTASPAGEIDNKGGIKHVYA